MLTIDPAQTPIPELHQYLIGAVAPRPIAFASTRSPEGDTNLAPYSFFNVFSSNPPILIFSSNRRVRGNTTKDTLHNVEATREVVINIVNHNLLHQMALASVEYPAGISEFEKTGLTPLPAQRVKAYRVAEAPVQFECKVRDIIPLGEGGGAGNLIVCEVVLIHIQKEILDEQGRIDPYKADLIARMGRAFYCRANGEAVFPVVRPTHEIGIGVDQLPEDIRLSHVLTGNDLARLAAVTEQPRPDMAIREDPEVMDALAGNAQDRLRRLHRYAQQLIEAGEIDKAWQVLLVD
ncbi:MAG: flavin reductase family protein [Bacteroidetes bacterium]|nr:MAG: flavin reductase family protein [Bacteroidota bacterium]